MLLNATVVDCFLGLCWVIIYQKVNYFVNDVFVLHILIKTLTHIWEFLKAITSGNTTCARVCLVYG